MTLGRSPVTLLSGEVWDKIKSDETLVLKPWEGQQFVGVSGSPLAIWGCSHVKLRLAQQESFQHQVLVIDSLVSEGIAHMHTINCCAGKGSATSR